MTVARPFKQLAFRDLPAFPTRPHAWNLSEDRFVEFDSEPFGPFRCRYREFGQGKAGKALLLLHGLMTTGYSWRYVVEALAKRFRVIVPDLPGHGRSSMPPRGYSGPGYAAWTLELMRALDIWGAPVVGNSLGGYIVMRAAIQQPSAFERVVSIHPPYKSSPRFYALRAAMGIPGSHRVLDSMVRANPMKWVHRNVHYFDETLKSREEAEEYAEPLSSKEGRRAFAALLANSLNPRDLDDFAMRLKFARRNGGFPVPLQLIYARQDPMVPPDHGEALAEAIPDAQMIWLERSSHFAHVDTPELVLGAMEGFLG